MPVCSDEYAYGYARHTEYYCKMQRVTWATSFRLEKHDFFFKWLSAWLALLINKAIKRHQLRHSHTYYPSGYSAFTPFVAKPWDMMLVWSKGNINRTVSVLQYYVPLNSAQWYEQFLQVGQLVWALILLGLALYLLSASVSSSSYFNFFCYILLVSRCG